jgi:hypothetical protein
MEHPYEEFEDTDLWNIVKKAVADLQQNQDIVLTTRLEYVVGYICKQLKGSNLLTAESLRLE